MIEPGVYAASTDMPREIRGWLARELRQFSPEIADALASRHRRQTDADRAAGVNPAHRRANVAIADYVTDNTAGKLPVTADAERVTDWADNRADHVRNTLHTIAGDEMDIYAAAANMVQGYGIEPPRPGRQYGLIGCIERMTCRYWWRRRVRTVIGRKHEQQLRSLSRVHRRAGLYVSKEGFVRWKGRQQKNAQTLADCIAVSEHGDEVPMSAVAAAGVSNPANRRAELMTRIRGAEDCANRRSHDALFVTLTVPPELHAVHSVTLQPGGGIECTPRDGQDWLCKQWAKARAQLDRAGIDYYGLRVAEPHHDGTPHWHLLLFVSKKHRASLAAILTRYAVNGSSDPGRIKRACEIVTIDRRRGSATGYVAKYVAKAIDGMGSEYAAVRREDGRLQALDIDPADAANRVRAWASTWGIRQFQFVGCPPVGPWRELRRLDAPIKGNATAETIRAAADAGDWAAYMEAMGGPCLPGKQRPARVRMQQQPELGRYGEPKQRAYVECGGIDYVTRPVRWSIEYRPAIEPRREYITVGIAPVHPVRGNALEISEAFGADWLERSAEGASTWTRENNCTEYGNHGLTRTGTDSASGSGRGRSASADRGTGLARHRAGYFHHSGGSGQTARPH